MSDTQLPAGIIPTERLLTAAEFHRLADVPPEVEWFANIRNRSTRRAYENAIGDFMRFTGISRPEDTGGGDVGMAEPFLDLGDVGLVVEGIGGGRRPQRMGANLEAQRR
ncbi:MAG: hypothetical protein WA184_24070 [Stellaceae bacterium]